MPWLLHGLSMSLESLHIDSFVSILPMLVAKLLKFGVKLIPHVCPLVSGVLDRILWKNKTCGVYTYYKGAFIRSAYTEQRLSECRRG